MNIVDGRVGWESGVGEWGGSEREFEPRRMRLRLYRPEGYGTNGNFVHT